MKCIFPLALFALAAGCGGSSPPAVEKAPVVVTVDAQQLQRGTVAAVVVAQGTAHAVRRKALYFEQDGRVSYVRSEDGRDLRVGDRVNGPRGDDLLGDLLARIDDREVTASLSLSRAELRRSQSQRRAVEGRMKSARADVDAAERRLARNEKLAKTGSLPQRDVDDARDAVNQAKAALTIASADLASAKSSSTASAASLERSEVALERVALFAPFDGVVAALNAREGDLFFMSAAATSDPIEQLRNAPIVIVDPSEYELKVSVPSFEAGRIAPGQAVYIVTADDMSEVRNEGLGGRSPTELTTRGEVYAVSPAVDPGDRSVQVVVRTTEHPERVRDGEFVSCYIVVNEAENVVVAPPRALQTREDVNTAWVVSEDSTVQHRTVEVGMRGVNGVEVTAGLEPGDVLVTRGHARLHDGDRVQPTMVTPQFAQGAPDGE